jgi:hypothetical protein
MHHIDTLLTNLEQNVPFALARFNDGEMMGIISPGSVVARGDQIVNTELSQMLNNALQYQQENYWVGLPCSTCFPEYSDVAKRLVDTDYEYLTHAVVFTNRNWKRVVAEVPELMKDRTIYWVSGHDQDISKLTFTITEQHIVPAVNAWKVYQSIKDLVYKFEKNSIVMISCGPMSRVLTKDWFSLRPDLTVLDIGSTWDPFTRDVWHNCHKGTLTPCPECN